jgi:hypothetical protein
MKAGGKWQYTSTYCYQEQLIRSMSLASWHRHVTSIPTEYEVGWALEVIWMIETEDRQGRVRTADKEGQAGHSKEPRQAVKAGGHGKVSEGKKGGRVSRLTKSAKGWVGREHKMNRQGTATT